MDFLNGIGKKISQASQTAVQKTKDMTEIARINGAISDEEKKINNAVYQIGKLYIEKHSADCEPEFAGLVGAIKESEAKISEYKNQVQDIKGVMRCDKCGGEIPNNVAFCSSCGAPVSRPVAAPPANMVNCSGCGALLESGVRFCTTCGTPCDNAGAVQPVAEPAPVAPQTCPNCSATIEPGCAFCTSCGTKL